MAFDRIREQVSSLQRAWRAWKLRATVVGEVRTAHAALVDRGLALAVRSAAAFAPDDHLVGAWSEIGTEGAMALVKAVELARIYDPEQEVISADERTWLVTLAALEAWRSGRQGIASALLKRQEAGRLASLTGAADASSVLLARLVHAICRSSAAELAQQAEEIRRAASVELRSTLSEVTEARPGPGGYLVVGAVAQAVLALARHLQEGDDASAEAALTWMARASRLAPRAVDVELRLLTTSLSRTLRGAVQLSVWRPLQTLFPGRVLPDRARQWAIARVKEGKSFIFPSQHEVLVQRRMLDQHHALVSLPTGGGKSLVAELFALRRLIAEPGGKVLVIVPSRALAGEKRKELEDGLGPLGVRVCQLTGDVALDADTAFQEHDLLVLTPEKLDTVMRSDFFDDLKIVGLVVDEFHTLRASYRGIKLQLSLARFRKRVGCPTLYISAIVRPADFEALAQWAHSPEPFSGGWKPTPSRIGLVNLKARPVLEAEFNDGYTLQVPLSEDVTKQQILPASRAVVRAFAREEQTLDFQLSWRGWGMENALYTQAQEYLDDGFVAEGIDSVANRAFAKRLERLAGRDDEIVKFFRAGIALHWGMLPHAARRIVEEAIRQRAVRLILSTSTLAEGVNLPIQTVYLRRLETQYAPLDMGTFLNVVGRAGRPFFHPEGQVVIGYADAARKVAQREQAERYQRVNPDDLPPIITAAVDVAERLQAAELAGQWREHELGPAGWEDGPPPIEGLSKSERDEVQALAELVADVENICSALLASLRDGLIERLDPHDALSDALFIGGETQAQRALTWRLLRLAQARLETFGAVERADAGRLAVTAWGRVVYRSGLGPESCTRIRARLLPILAQFNRPPRDWQWVNGMYGAGVVWPELAELLDLPWERWRIGVQAGRLPPVWLLARWIAGQPLDWRREAPAEAGPVGRITYLLNTSQVEGVLSPYGAWVFLTASMIAAHERTSTGWASALDRLARCCLYGHYDEDVHKMQRRDTGRLVLRDDLVQIYDFFIGSRTRDFARFRRGDYRAAALRIQLRLTRGLRMDDEELAALLERMFDPA